MFACNGRRVQGKHEQAASIVDVMTRSELMGKKCCFLGSRKEIGEAGKGCVL